jgi:hypothetical protein
MASKFIGVRLVNEVPKSARDGGSKYDTDIETICAQLKKNPGCAVQLQSDEKYISGFNQFIKNKRPEWKSVIREKTNIFVWLKEQT